MVRRRLKDLATFSVVVFTLHFSFLLVRLGNENRYPPQECVGDSVSKLKVQVIRISIVPRRYE